MHPSQHHNTNQSLAQAVVRPNIETQYHYHAKTEELYHIVQGIGRITLNDAHFNVEAGDTICIPPNARHKIKNTGEIDLVFLCCCSPAYSHEDTFLIESDIECALEST
ncbi:cupin domain-containing protein [Beggiatoa alba]|nr:cupin domain-containing protein [Beggiatoa alba]